jgi:hypothetical protein
MCLRIVSYTEIHRYTLMIKNKIIRNIWIFLTGYSCITWFGKVYAFHTKNTWRAKNWIKHNIFNNYHFLNVPFLGGDNSGLLGNDISGSKDSVDGPHLFLAKS